MKIPHQPPYRLITGVAAEGEGRGRGWAPPVTARAPALLIEIAAQVCAALEAGEGEGLAGGVLASARGFKLPAAAPIGALTIEATRLRAMGAQRMWRVAIQAEGALIAAGALIFSR